MTVKAVLIDLSGTLHIDKVAIPGSVDALKTLRSTSIKIRFITNTTKESKRTLVNRLSSLGFGINDEEVFTSLSAAHDIVNERKLTPLLFLEDDALHDFTSFQLNPPNFDAVVIGLAPRMFNFNELNRAFKMLKEGAQFIAIHKSMYYQRSDGLALGPGGFVSLLEAATGRKAEVVGKPVPSFFTSCLSGLNVLPEEAIMIGDDVKDDVGGAQNIGIRGILVKTGKYRDGDENKIVPPPFHVSENFSKAVEFILKELV